MLISVTLDHHEPEGDYILLVRCRKRKDIEIVNQVVIEHPGQRTELKMAQWHPFLQAVPALYARLACRGSDFVMQQWPCKYIDARIDMRTGKFFLKPGNDA